MKYIKPLAICLILLAICGYYHRQPTEDDAWFAEESFWLLKVGHVKSAFFSGFLGWENNYFLSHKLFIALGAGFQYLLPLSPYTVKLSGLIPFGVLIFLLVFYQHQNQPHISVWLLLAFIFSNTLLVKMGFENRPEVLVATLGFASFLLIYQNTNLLKSALAGLFASLAALSHLNGLIYVMAGFLMLLYFKEYRNLFIFSVLSLTVGSLYFYDIWLFDGFSTWQWQFINDPATQSTIGLTNKMKVILAYPKLFFESPEQAVLSVLLLVLGWYGRKYLGSINRRLMVYSLVLFLSFWVLTKSATAIYQVLFIPTFFVLSIELYGLLVKNKQLSKPIYVVAGLYLCVGIVGNLQIVFKNNDNYLPSQFANLSTKIVAKKTGLVPLTFFFNEYSRYEKLLCQTNFELQMKQRKIDKPTPSLFFEWAKQNKVDFVVLDYVNTNADYYPNPKTPRVGNYQQVYGDGQFVVYMAQK